MSLALVFYAAVASLGLLCSTASAYSWQFTNTVQQCQNLSLSLSGSGQPPYSVLVVPYGHLNPEVRSIINTPFTETSVTFPIDYPANSQFVAVVSDSSGFGSGGTSLLTTVQDSSNSGCFDSTQQNPPEFTFSTSGNIIECSPVQIYWTQSAVKSTPDFQGIIPGGQSFTIPESNLSTLPGGSQGFTWIPPLRADTTLIITGGDSRGVGTAGSASWSVLSGSQDCINSNSPSTTPGNPAGGVPTGTTGSTTVTGITTSIPSPTNTSTSGGGNHSSNVGAIAGGAVGGVCGLLAALALGGLYMRRRRRAHLKTHAIDLLQGPSDENGGEHLPLYYRPEPYPLSEPSTSSAPSVRPMSERPSSASFLMAARSETPSEASTGRTGKSAVQPSLRTVNLVQHEDAGPPPRDEPELEPETVELPPAYTNLRGALLPPTGGDGSPPSRGSSMRA